MNLPSVKTLERLFDESEKDKARELRRILEIKDRNTLESVLDAYPVTRKWYFSCYNPLELTAAKMSIADEILGTYGVEYVKRGHGANSPAFEYCNTGDSYALTLLFDGRYRVSSWGDIVERGNYD